MACSKCTAACSCKLLVADTNTVDLTLTGAGSKANPWVVSGEVILTADDQVPNPDSIGVSENLIKRGDLNGADDGIYVSCEDVQDCVGQLVNDVLSGIIYDDPDNTFTVNVESAVVVDCGLDGDGTAGDPLTVELDPTVDNALLCGTGPGGTGLYVPPAAAPCVSPTNPDCLRLDVDGCIELVIAPSPNADGCDNALVCTPEGLYVHAPQLLTMQMSPAYRDGFPATLNDELPNPLGGNRFHNNAPGVNGGNGDPTSNAESPVGTIQNPDPCCPMFVRLDYNLQNQPTFESNADLCALAAQFRATGPNNSGRINLITSFDIFIDGVNTGQVDGRRASWVIRDPAAGLEGCGVTMAASTDADNELSTVIIPPGGNAVITYRLRSAFQYVGPGAIGDQQVQDFIEGLFKGTAPFPADNGEEGPFTLAASRVGAQGMSSCNITEA